MATPTKPAIISTSGPWRSSARTFRTHTHSGRPWERSIATSDGVIVATAYGTTPEEAEANAERIAALPDLVASVRDFVALYGNVYEVIGPQVREKIDRARASLAKAEEQS